MSSLGRYAWGGLLGGAGAGLLVAAFDLLLMPGADRSTAVALLLGGTLVPLLAAVGAAAGALLAALRLAAAALARRTRGAADLWSAAIIAAATTPLAVVLVQRLASGQQARRVIGALWAKAPLVAAVVLLAGFFAWLALRVGTAPGAARGAPVRP